MKTGVISLTMSQHKTLDVINRAIAGYLTVKEAAEKLGLSTRQIKRLKKGVKEEGPAALVHKNSLHKPSHALSEATKEKILKLRGNEVYTHSNFKHFQELLDEHEKITISYSALYRLLKANNISSPKTKRRYKIHRRRKRRDQAGSLLQMDASPFAWFWITGDSTMYSLHGAIDDATGQVTGLYLCKNECMLGYFEVLRQTVTNFGVPESAYADRHTIFRSPNLDKKLALDAHISSAPAETQFGRSLSELSIRLIAARSPQGKGRVERLWNTLQSRLPTELKLRGITDLEAANAFLADEYRFIFNSEFAVEPADEDSAFLPLPENLNLDHVLCVKEQRTVDHGLTFSYYGKSFKLEASPYISYLPSKAKITVLASPRIGIKASYRQFVFDTVPCVKPKKQAKKKTPPKTETSSKSHGNFIPTDGLPWQPGLPAYQESLEILREIFLKKYA